MNAHSKPRIPTARRAAFAVGIATTSMCALAAGALVCLVSLRVPFDVNWLIFPVGILLACVLRWHVIDGWRGAVAATLAILLAFAYVQYLLAAVRVASLLGFPLRSTLFTMDFALGWQVIRASMNALTLGALGAAILFGAAIAYRGKR